MFLYRSAFKFFEYPSIMQVLKQSRCNSALAKITSSVIFTNVMCPNIEITSHFSKITVSLKILDFSKYKRLFYSSPQFFFSSDDNDIPEYLKEIVSEVSDLEEEDLEDKELENNMEDEIIDFLYSRALLYEELEGSLIVRCPSCGYSNKTHEMFIDKNSGYSVCPWCLWDGCWQDLTKLIDAKVDTLEAHQLNNYFSHVQPIAELHLSNLSSSPLMGIGIDHFAAIEIGITEDHSRLVFPLKGVNDKKVGFASMSLVHSNPKFIIRVLEGKSSVFHGLPLLQSKKKLERVIVVPEILDALHLAKFKLHSIVLIADPKPDILNWVLKNCQKVVFWLSSQKISQSLLASVRTFDCYAVRLTTNQRPITSLPKSKILGMISDAVPIFSEEIITTSDLQSKIFERVLNKEKLFGVKWTRFSKLNELLLGHREGELTIFSGLTGSGKTTLMSEYSLDLSMQGVCTLWASFEVSLSRLCEVMMQQFSGSALPEDHSDFSALVQEFSKLPLYFLNVHGQQPLEDVISFMAEAVLVKGVRHVIIDNLQFMLGQHGASGDWWLEQDRAVGAFRQFSTVYGCHVTLIVHPKKLNQGEKLTLNSISGGARVTQEADNVMILHVQENNDNSGPKTLQIAKNRYGGTLGEMKLRFHKKSLTLSSCFRKPQNEFSQKQTRSSMQLTENSSYSGVIGLPFFNLKR